MERNAWMWSYLGIPFTDLIREKKSTKLNNKSPVLGSYNWKGGKVVF